MKNIHINILDSFVSLIVFSGSVIAAATAWRLTNCGFWGTALRGLCGWAYVAWHFYFKHLQ